MAQMDCDALSAAVSPAGLLEKQLGYEHVWRLEGECRLLRVSVDRLQEAHRGIASGRGLAVSLCARCSASSSFLGGLLPLL